MNISFNFNQSTKIDNGTLYVYDLLGSELKVRCQTGHYFFELNNSKYLIEGDLYYYHDEQITEYLSNKSNKYLTDFFIYINVLTKTLIWFVSNSCNFQSNIIIIYYSVQMKTT